MRKKLYDINNNSEFKIINEEHNKIGDVFFDIACRNFKQKNLLEAEQNFKNSLDAYIKSYGSIQKNVLMVYYYLSIISSIKKNREDLYLYDKKIMEVAELLFKGLENNVSEKTIIVLVKSAKVFQRYHIIKKAEKFYNRAVDIYKKMKEIENTNWSNLGLLIDIYSSLAFLYKKNRSYDKALVCFEIIIDVRIDLNQEWRRDLFSIYKSVGEIYYHKGRYNESIVFFEKSLKVLSKESDKDKITISDMCLKLADIHCELKLYDQADIYYKLAFNVSKDVGQEHSLEVCKYIISKVKVYSDYKLKQYIDEEIKISKEIIIRKQLNISYEFEKLANIYFNDGIKEEAVELYKKSFNIRSKLLTGNEYENGLLMYNIATLYTEHKLEEAEKYFKDAIKLWKKSIGEYSDEVAKAYNNLGVFYVNLGKNVLAEKYLRKALEIRKNLNDGNEDETSINLKLNLGNVYLKMNKFEIAENLYQYILNFYNSKYGENSKQTADLLYNFGVLYKKQNKSKIAIKYLKKALNIYNNVQGTDNEFIEKISNYIDDIKKGI
jgi:tetratricopeptide (TPR) repeat protein